MPRSTKGTGRRLPTTRSLVGRAGYFAVKTGIRPGLPSVRQQGKAPTSKPPWFRGTLPEWAVWDALVKLDYKPDQDFVYQYRMGDFGASSVIDFFIRDPQIGIEVQGLFWHYEFGGFQVGNDLTRKIRLESLGIRLVYIDEDNLVGARADPLWYVQEAVAGRDHSRAASGSM